MQLYDTLTKKTEDIQPLDGQTFRIYSCGPTVYDHIHIGNLSSFIFADTLRRTLLATGKQVKHVMNFTDVDDKTIRRSQEKYPQLDPLAALLKLTGEYSDIFLQDMKSVGNQIDNMTFIKATDSIATMQDLIKQLYSEGFAYLTDDGIYFSIEAYKKSGKIYGQLTEVTTSSTSEARIQNDEYDKESAHDFALWKKQKPGEPGWNFELDGHDITGRPGWHIECSAMSSQSLGQPFDIHTGGIDLIFPHHENEIAQSTAGKDNASYAQHFAHNEHLLVDNQKMSKSLQNFYTLEDIMAKGYDPLAFRLLVLQAHYRKPAHFSWDNLTAAQNSLQNLYEWADTRHQSLQTAQQPEEVSTTASIKERLLDDLDTPGALAGLYKVAGEQIATTELLTELDALFGFKLAERVDITEEQKSIIAERENARQHQDWAMSDKLREQLLQQGIALKDTDNGPIWSRSGSL